MKFSSLVTEFTTVTCFVIAGVLVGIQFVHYIEHQVGRIKQYSYFRYLITLIGIFVLTAIIYQVDGFKSDLWFSGVINFLAIILSIFLTVKYLFKKKGIRYKDYNGYSARK